MNKHEARELFSGPFGKMLMETAMSYVIPLFWGIPEYEEKSVFNSGSAFILDLGNGPFLVTAAHVYDGYLKCKSENTGLVCQLGSITFELESRLICRRDPAKLDMATFRISEDEIFELEKTAISDSALSLSRMKIEVEDGVFFGGFPGKLRQETGVRECEFGMYFAFTPVSSVSDRHIGCAFETEEWIDAIGNGIPEEGYDLGGISGAPLLRVTESENSYFRNPVHILLILQCQSYLYS
ncbi:hypothetical protein ACFL2V_22125 [Pseudomonadota bacterium]